MGKLRKIGALATGATSLVGAEVAMAQNADVSLEFLKPQTENLQRARINAFYEIPGGVNAYTFVEHYTGDDSNLSKTILSKNIYKGLTVNKDVVVGTGFRHANLGVGFGTGNKKGFLSLKFLPLTYGKDGFRQDNVVGVAGSYDTSRFIPDSNLEGFLEASLGKGLNFDPKVSFGELYFNKDINLGKNRGTLGVGIGADITDTNQGGINVGGVVDLHPALKFKYSPNSSRR